MNGKEFSSRPVGSRSTAVVDGCGCPDVVAWVERSRSERTSGGVGRRGKGLKEWQGGSFPLNRSVPDLSNVFRVPLAIHTRPSSRVSSRSARRPPASIFLSLPPPPPRNDSLREKLFANFFCTDTKESWKWKDFKILRLELDIAINYRRLFVLPGREVVGRKSG